MRELVISAVGFVLQLAVFFCAGSLLMNFLKMKKEAMTAVIIGYLAYFAVFELLAVPMTLLLVPLKVLAAVWAVFLAAVCLFAIVRLHKQWICQLKEFFAGTGKMFREHSGWLLPALAAAVLQCLIVILYQDSTQDAAYYVGTVSTSVYTDTLGRYNPFTGQAISAFSARYVFSAFPMNNAVWCVITGLPALIQCKIVMSLINVLVANGIIWQTGRQLFGGEKKTGRSDGLSCFSAESLYGNHLHTGNFSVYQILRGKSPSGKCGDSHGAADFYLPFQDLEHRECFISQGKGLHVSYAFGGKKYLDFAVSYSSKRHLLFRFSHNFSGGDRCRCAAAACNKKETGKNFPLLCLYAAMHYVWNCVSLCEIWRSFTECLLNQKKERDRYKYGRSYDTGAGAFFCESLSGAILGELVVFAAVSSGACLDPAYTQKTGSRDFYFLYCISGVDGVQSVSGKNYHTEAGF